MSLNTPAPPRRYGALAVLCVSLLIVSLDMTIVNVALPTLVRELHSTSSQLQWIVDSYAVTFAGFLLVAGSLGDRIGRKWTLLAGLVVFGAGSAGSAFSGSFEALVLFRGVMGVGSALIMPATLSIITDIFRDPEERARAIGMWAGVTGLGIAIGPIVGGWLLEHYWWGSVFLVNVPIAVAGLIAAALVVPNSRDPAAGPPDLAGAAMSVVGLGLLLWAIIEAPARGWTSPYVIAVGAVSLGVLTVFVGWERKVSNPMLDLGFFSSRRFSAATSSLGLVVFSLLGALFVLTQFLQFVLGYTPVEAGLRILPVAAVLVAAAPVSSVLVRWVGTKLVVTAGLLAIAGGLWQLATATSTSTFNDVLGGMLLLGLGAGLAMPSATDSVMGSLPQEKTGLGSATNGTSLQVGGSLGVAVIGSILATRYVSHMTATIAGHGIPAAVAETITGSVGGAIAVAQHVGGQLGAELAGAARVAFTSGMDLSLSVGAVVALASVVLALVALPSRPSPTAGGVGAGPAGGFSPRRADVAPRRAHKTFSRARQVGLAPSPSTDVRADRRRGNSTHGRHSRQKGATMKAKVGDRLVVKGHHAGEPDKDAEILEVRGRDGGPPYLVRWSDDGHEGLLFPGPDALVEHFQHAPPKR